MAILGDRRGAQNQLLVFLIAVSAYAAIGAYGLERQVYPITGDEPHYLVAAHALAYHGSLDVRPIYGHGVFAALGVPKAPHVAAVGEALISGHGLALPLLLALPYRIGGVLGAKLALCALVALLVSRFAPILMRWSGAPRWSLAVAIVLALSLPYTMAAGAVYPDLLVGLLSLWLLDDLMTGFASSPAPRWRMLRYGMMSGLLPWLHQRHIAVAAIFATALVLRARTEGERPGRRRPLAARPPGPPTWIALLAFFALVAPNLVFARVLSAAQLTANQPHPPDWDSATILLGMHLDQLHGLFLQNPLLFAALIGLPRFARARPAMSLLWGVVYLALLLPVTVFRLGYGGWTLAGRYQWDVAPLWVYPLGAFVGWLLVWRRGRVVLATLLGGALWAQAAFAARWLTVYEYMLPKTQVLWGRNSLYGGLRDFLPCFSSPQQMFAHRPNWVWLGLALLCVLLGVAWRHGRRATVAAGAAMAAAAAGAVLAWRPVYEPIGYPPAQLAGEVGRPDGGARLAREGLDAPGVMLKGPYLSLRAGCYATTLAYEAGDDGGEPSSWMLTAFDPAPWRVRRLAGGPLPAAGAGGRLRETLAVPAGSDLQGFEFRLLFSGRGWVRVHGLTIEAGTQCG
jgi:hypothetical protein